MKDLNVDYLFVQILYAKKWQELGILSFEEALLKKTCIYKLLFGTTPKNEVLPLEWKATVRELEKADPYLGATMVAQLKKSGLLPPPHKSDRGYSRYFGPFRYSYDAEKKEIFLHFNIKDQQEEIVHWRKGKEDLCALFKEVKEKLPDALTLKVETTLMFNGFWKRMCPHEFFDQLTPIRDENAVLMQETPWSQFIDFQGRAKEEVIKQFITKISSAKDKEDLAGAFPVTPVRGSLRLEVPYRFYGL